MLPPPHVPPFFTVRFFANEKKFDLPRNSSIYFCKYLLKMGNWDFLEYKYGDSLVLYLKPVSSFMDLSPLGVFFLLAESWQAVRYIYRPRQVRPSGAAVPQRVEAGQRRGGIASA